MKKYSVLLALFFFSCTSEIESPESILEKHPEFIGEISSSSYGSNPSGNSSSSEGNNPSWTSSSSQGSNPSGNSSSSSSQGSNPGENSSSSQGSNPNETSSSSNEASSSGSGDTSSSSEAESYQLLSNVDFAGGVLAPWEKGFGSLSPDNRGEIKLKYNDPYGYDAIFVPSGKEVNDWDLQLIQKNLDIKPGYSYRLKFGGGSNGPGDASVALVLMTCRTSTECEGECVCDDYIKWNASLPSDDPWYQEFEDLGSWENCSVTNPKAIFVISGGEAKSVKNGFKIGSVEIFAEPISCP